MTEACSRCGTFFKDERDVMFSEAGDKVCAKCFDVGEIDAAGQRTAQWVKTTGYLSPLVAMGALFLWRVMSLAGLLLVVASVISAVGVLNNLRKDELRARLGGHVVPVTLCLIASIGIAVIGGLLSLVF